MFPNHFVPFARCNFTFVFGGGCARTRASPRRHSSAAAFHRTAHTKRKGGPVLARSQHLGLVRFSPSSSSCCFGRPRVSGRLSRPVGTTASFFLSLSAERTCRFRSANRAYRARVGCKEDAQKRRADPSELLSIFFFGPLPASCFRACIFRNSSFP